MTEPRKQFEEWYVEEGFDCAPYEPAPSIAYEAGQASMRPLIKKMREALLDFKENTVIPEPDCNCPVAPPCNDCVEYSYIRDVLKSAKSAIAEADKFLEEQL